MKTYREQFVRHLVDTGRLNLRNGPFLYVWPTFDAEHPNGVADIARKYTRQPGPCEQYVLWLHGLGPEPNFPACQCDDCR